MRIPTQIMQAARLEIDQQVEITEEDGRIIITPVQSLEALVAGITDKNLHECIEL